MSFADRWFTSQTARAILSWRIVAGAAVGVAGFVAGVAWLLAIGLGAAAYVALVALGMPRAVRRPKIDPFTVGEPWRRFVQGAQRAAARLHETVASIQPGPLRERMDTVVERLDHGVEEAFRIARRGDEIDAAIARLDPTALRSRLTTLEQQQELAPDDQIDAAIASVEQQLATTERLREQSTQTANRLRLTQTRLDELAARAVEVAIGQGDTDAYEHDVDDLVVELEGLRLALEETNRS